jgi:putative FmdB family regulatory protein
VPTYSYRCTECASAFDIVQAFTDDTLTVCPTCGGKLRKVFSPVGVSFSGSGFYRTDSRAAEKSKSGSASGSSGSSSDTPAAASSSSESSSTAASPTSAKVTPGKEATKPATSSGGSSASPGS